jgi:hypothetical protein
MQKQGQRQGQNRYRGTPDQRHRGTEDLRTGSTKNGTRNARCAQQRTVPGANAGDGSEGFGLRVAARCTPPQGPGSGRLAACAGLALAHAVELALGSLGPCPELGTEPA